MDELWDSHVFRKHAGTTGAVMTSEERYKPLKDEQTNGTSSSSNNSASTVPAGGDPVYDSFSRSTIGGVPPSPLLLPIESLHPPSIQSLRVTSFRRELALIGSRILLVAFTAGISIVFPNFGLIVSLVGSFSNSAIAFILPQIFYLKLVVIPESIRSGSVDSPDTWTRWRSFILPYVIIVLGVIASIIGVYTTIKDMVDGDDS